jgi:hypothetical protein
MDNYNRTNTQQFFVMIDSSPIVYGIEHHFNVSIEFGSVQCSVQLRANCRPMRGYIVDKRWENVSGPADVGEIKPSKGGYIKFSKAGIYTFEYKFN